MPLASQRQSLPDNLIPTLAVHFIRAGAGRVFSRLNKKCWEACYLNCDAFSINITSETITTHLSPYRLQLLRGRQKPLSLSLQIQTSLGAAIHRCRVDWVLGLLGRCEAVREVAIRFINQAVESEPWWKRHYEPLPVGAWLGERLKANFPKCHHLRFRGFTFSPAQLEALMRHSLVAQRITHLDIHTGVLEGSLGDNWQAYEEIALKLTSLWAPHLGPLPHSLRHRPSNLKVLCLREMAIQQISRLIAVLPARDLPSVARGVEAISTGCFEKLEIGLLVLIFTCKEGGSRASLAPLMPLVGQFGEAFVEVDGLTAQGPHLMEAAICHLPPLLAGCAGVTFDGCTRPLYCWSEALFKRSLAPGGTVTKSQYLFKCSLDICSDSAKFASVQIRTPLSVQFSDLPCGALAHIARFATAVPGARGFSLACKANLHACLATCPKLVLRLDSTKVSRFLSPAVLGVLRARKQPLQLQLRWNVEGPQYNIPDMLRFVIGLLWGCTAVKEVVIDGLAMEQAELGAWLGATLADSFPELTSLTLAGDVGYEGLSGLLSDPALKAQLLHLDLSHALLYGHDAAAFYKAAASLHSLHTEQIDSPAESLHDLPCQWRTLRAKKANLEDLDKLPLHAVKEVVHIDLLCVRARGDSLDDITAGASCFAAGVSVRPTVGTLRVIIADSSEEDLAVLAALQPLAGCVRVVDVVCGDWASVDSEAFDADVMEALRPVCQGCSELWVRRATLKPSVELWLAIVDGVPSIAFVYIHQCFQCDELVLESLQEFVKEHGGRDMAIHIDYFLQSPLGAHEGLGECDLSAFDFGPVRVCVDEMDFYDSPFDAL
ncbi:hypothetical protein V8C86DRAFT_2439812 [Haematococcus lacustris]